MAQLIGNNYKCAHKLHSKSVDWFLYEGNTVTYWVKLHILYMGK